jgi:type III restriction enzyme
LLPVFDPFEPQGSTAAVRFQTRKATYIPTKSEVSHVTLDGATGNTWERLLAEELEINTDVAAYAKNDHLGFTIPYVHKGRTHQYVPDFLIRLRSPDPDEPSRTLIIEVSGSHKSPGPTKAKAETARHSWCRAVNNHGGFGAWGYAELTDPAEFRTGISDAIERLYADQPGDHGSASHVTASRRGHGE